VQTECAEDSALSSAGMLSLHVNLVSFRSGPQAPAWRNWQTRWTQNPVIARSCGFEPLRRQTVLPCRIGKVTPLLPFRCGAKRRSPYLLRGKINQISTSNLRIGAKKNHCDRAYAWRFMLV